MKKKVITALVLALALVTAPVGSLLATTSTASSNNSGSESTSSGNNSGSEGTNSGNNTDGGETGGGEETGGDTSDGGSVSGGTTGGSSTTIEREDGTKVTSTIATYNTSSLVPSVAVTTPQNVINSIIGVTGTDYAHVSIIDSQCGPEAKTAVTNAASSAGAKMAAILDIDVSIFAKNGSLVESVTELSSPIEFTISTPTNVDAGLHDFAIVRLHGDGQVDILPDIDNDLSTITFQTDRFSVYAVIYGDKGSFDAFKTSSRTGAKDSVPKTGEY